MAAEAEKDEAWQSRPGVRAVVVDDVGRVLILRRPADSEFGPNLWNLPGGGQDPGETSLEGAERELREETGLRARATGASMPFTFPGGQGTAYLFREPVGEPSYPAREVSEARWVYPSELPREVLPGTAEAIAGLAGTGDAPMRELDLTARRRWLEAQAGEAVAPWLRAMVKELAGRVLGDRLPLEAFAKALSPDDPEYQRIKAIFKANEAADRARTKAIHKALDTDGMGEKAFLKTLMRAVQLGRAEAAQAILIDAKHGKLPAGKSKLKEATTAALKVVARRHLRQVKETTERKLAAIAMQPDAATVTTLLAKLYDVKRSDMIGQNLVAEGYVNGVADVLRQYGYNRVYIRTMADDRVCRTCQHFDTTPTLARMTIRQALKRLPIHPHCRCWISPTPNEAPAPLNFKAPRTKIVKGGLLTSLRVLEAYGAGVGQTQVAAVTGGLLEADFIKAFSPEQKAAIASQIAKKRNRIGGKFAAGKVTADKAPKGKPKKPKPQAKATAGDLLAQANSKVKAQEAKAIAAAAGGGGKKPPKAGKKATGGGGGGDAGKGKGAPGPKGPGKKPAPPQPSVSVGGPEAVSGLTVDTTSPDHLIQAGAAILEHLRQATPGTESHAHLLTQYNAMRAAIKTWNQTKGGSASPSSPTVDGGNVKIGPAPKWVPGGAAKLTSPKQFEVAVLHAGTKEEATELAHYFERYTHNQGVAGDKAWDGAWKDIKAAIKELPAEGQTPKGKPGGMPDTPKELAQEHQHLVDVLEDAGTPEAAKEAKAQQAELDTYKAQTKGKGKPKPAPEATPDAKKGEPAPEAQATSATPAPEPEASSTGGKAPEAPEASSAGGEPPEAPEAAPTSEPAPEKPAPKGKGKGKPKPPPAEGAKKPIDMERLVKRSKSPHDLAKKLVHLILQGGAEVQQENLKPKD